MKYPILYKRDTVGKIQQWQMEVEGGRFRSISGEVDGKQTTAAWVLAEPKNPGKANETSIEQQATKEAEAKIKDKKKKGYTEDIENVDEAAVYRPMLAEDFKDYEDKIIYPVFGQPKLDGIRSSVWKGKLWSRENNEFTSCPHIVEALAPICKMLGKDERPDGELYNHKYRDDFNAIVKLVKREKLSEEQLEQTQKLVQFWCYDIAQNKPFIERMKWIRANMGNRTSIVVVPTVELKNRKELDEYYYDDCLENGYEGVIIRSNEVYKHKRHQCLLKRKEFITEEFDILAIEVGTGIKADQAAVAVLRNTDGKEFRSTFKGSHDWCRQALIDKDKIIGQRGTVKFQKRTPDGVPKFSNLISVRNYE